LTFGSLDRADYKPDQLVFCGKTNVIATGSKVGPAFLFCRLAYSGAVNHLGSSLYILLDICDVISQRELNESEIREEYIINESLEGRPSN